MQPLRILQCQSIQNGVKSEFTKEYLLPKSLNEILIN